MNSEEKSEVVYLYLDDIIPNRFQPREVFDEKALKELAVSIKEHGVIQPIIVRRANGKYEIIAGERRYKASALAGATKIPSIIRDLDDKEAAKVALLENLQRKNLNAIEEARTYQKILELDQMTQDDLAKTMGKSQSAVANKIRLLSLPLEVQDALLKEKISERHARTLVGLEDADLQIKLLKKIISEKMSVRKLEEEIKKERNKDNMQQFENQTNDNEPSYVNYGEINNEIDDNQEQITNQSNNIDNIDIKTIKSNSVDIPSSSQGQQTSLDSMLNITDVNRIASIPQTNNIPSIENRKEVEEFKFITPAEHLINNNDENIQPTDYFDAPPIVSTTTEVPLVNDNNEKSNQNIKDRESAIDAVRNIVKEIKDNNIKIEMDEMDFNSSYQIIIKLEK